MTQTRSALQISTSVGSSLSGSPAGSASIGASTLRAASTASVRPATSWPATAAAVQVRVQRSRCRWRACGRVCDGRFCAFVFRHGRVRNRDAQLQRRAGVREHVRRFPVCDGGVSQHEKRHLHQDVSHVRASRPASCLFRLSRSVTIKE